LLLPGFVGLADNGDFAKVSGYLSLAPVRTTNFIYFQPNYVRAARNFWDSPYHSSETPLAWLAVHASGTAGENGRFDIRWLGALHIALYVAAFAFLLKGVESAAKAVLPLVIFTDVCYAAYLNTFYMDAVALCGLLLMTAIAVWMVRARANSTGAILLFAAAALVFVLSKAQHAVWMVLPAAFLASRRRRASWIAAGVVMIAGIVLLGTSDRAYRGQAMFNLLFYRIAPQSAEPKTELVSLGARAEELRFVGMHSYVEGTPTANRQWTEEFYQRTGFRRLVGWYAGHPMRTLGYLWDTLRIGGPEMRPENLANFPEGVGRRPGEHTARLGGWSALRSEAMRRWPWHVPVWWGIFFAGCAWAWTRGSKTARALAPVAAGIGLLAVGEFLGAALGDCLDPGRHLFLFQVCTEISFCFGAAWVISTLGQARKRQTP
jgi:hypothetical protein